MHEHKDTWANGAAYEYYIGRWSRLVARKFIAWLDISFGARWLDVGCGTGILSQTILDVACPQRVLGIDSSEGYVEYARKHIQNRHVSFRLGDAQALPVESASYDAAVSGLVLNFVQAKSNVRRDDKSCTYGWNCRSICLGLRRPYAAYTLLLDAAVALDKKVVALDEGQRFTLCQPEPLTIISD